MNFSQEEKICFWLQWPVSRNVWKNYIFLQPKCNEVNKYVQFNFNKWFYHHWHIDNLTYLSSLQPSPRPNISVVGSWLFLGGLLFHPIPSHCISKVKQFAVLSNLDKVFFWYVSIFISNFGRSFFIKINLNWKGWKKEWKGPFWAGVLKISKSNVNFDNFNHVINQQNWNILFMNIQ